MTRRMLDSRVWTNDRFGQMPIMARLLLLGIINLADDQGRLMAHPVYLRSQVFPYDDVSIDDIRKWLKLIATNGTIAIYMADGKDYIQLLNWWEYQSLQYPAPSEYPAQPGWQDRVRYNAKGGVVLTYNYTTMKGERLPDTCNSRGVPLAYSREPLPDTPTGNPPGIPTWDTHLDTPLGAPIQLEDQEQDQETTAPPSAPAAAKPKDHLAVLAYRELHERYPTKAQMKIIAERDPPLGDWVRAIRQWAANGYNPRNIDRMLEWAFNPALITERIYPNGAKRGTNQGNTQAHDEPEYDPERQRQFDEFRAKRKADGSLYYR